MTNKIEWIPAYSVGREDLDSQHQNLFRLVDSIPDDWRSRDLKKCVMKLFKYTREHFLAEEKVLTEINYPDLEAHKGYHEELINKLVIIGEEGLAGEQALIDFKDFAYNWITDHILQQDHKYLNFVKKNNLTW